MTDYYVARKIVLAWPEVKDGQEGYAVKYRNGHRSWCPKEDFEKDNRRLGHNLGMYTYEQQLLMAELAEFEDKREALYRLEEAGDELASIERKVISLYIEVLQRKIAKFATVEVVTEEPQEPLAVAGDGSKTYLPMALADVKDFNFFRAAASMVDQIKEIKSLRLTKVLAGNGEVLDVQNELVVNVGNGGGAFTQVSGNIPEVGLFNFAINLQNGDITASTRPNDGQGTFEGLVFGWDVEWGGPGDVVNDARERTLKALEGWKQADAELRRICAEKGIPVPVMVC